MKRLTLVLLLFDLENDFGEMQDLSRPQTERVAHFRNLLLRELEGREEGFVQGGKLIPGRPQSPTLPHAGWGRRTIPS